MSGTKFNIINTTLNLKTLRNDEHLFVKTPDNTIYRIHKEKNYIWGFDPRTDCKSNLGTMYCWYWYKNHSLALGDKHSYGTSEEFLRSLLSGIISGEPYFGQPVLDFVQSGKASTVRFDANDEEHPGCLAAYGRDGKDGDWEYITDIAWPVPVNDEKEGLAMRVASWLTVDEIKAVLDSLPDVCILPLHLIIKRNLSMSVNSSNDPCEYGRIGYIFCTRDRAMEFWAKKPEDFDTPTAWKERAKKELTDEVERYNIYLRGKDFNVIIEKCIATQEDFGEEDDFTELPDSCFELHKSLCGCCYDQDGEKFITDTIGDDFRLWPFVVDLPIGPMAKQAAFEASFWDAVTAHSGHSIDIRCEEGTGDVTIFCRGCGKAIFNKANITVIPKDNK